MAQATPPRLVSDTPLPGPTARELVAGGALLLDVRTHDEFRAQHVAGAVNVPLHELSTRIAGFGPKKRPVVVYCRSGKRSAEAARLLGLHGFHHVRDLGAMPEWPHTP